MSITPMGGAPRLLISQRDKSPASTSTEARDDDNVASGVGVIDSTGEYASMSMLAANHVRRRNSPADNQDEWTRFSERILDEQADEKISRIEGELGHQLNLLTPKQLRTFLLGYFSDPSDLLMVLAALIHRNRIKQEQIERLKELQRRLQQEGIDRNTLAGINIALVAKAFAQKMQQAAGNLRLLYREFISYDGPLIYLYEQWIEDLAFEMRENMMRYLERALACDLQALPLCDINALEFCQFFNRMGRLREIQSLDVAFRQRCLQIQFGSTNQGIEKALSKLFVSGIRSWQGFNENLLVFFSEQLNVLSSDMRVRFLQLLLNAFSSFPTNVFCSMEERECLIEGLKEHMDYVMRQQRTFSRSALFDGSRVSHE